MKSILKFAALFVAASLSVVGASAQVKQESATIPFAFHVNDSTLPAGTYTIRSEGPTPFLQILDWEKSINVVTIGHPDPHSAAKPYTIVFHRYGDQYFLHEIVRGDPSDGLYFVPTKAEKIAKRRTTEAGLRVDDPVLVAMN